MKDWPEFYSEVHKIFSSIPLGSAYASAVIQEVWEVVR